MSTRGTYVTDRDRERFLPRLGADAATDYATSYAVTRVLDPAMPAITMWGTFVRGAGGARKVYVGMQAFQDRGRTPLAQIGGEWWHSVSDRSLAIDRITTDFQALANDLATWHAANVHDDDPKDAAARAQWIAADVTPTINEWHTFADRERASWIRRFVTSWDAFEDWQDRLRRLRELARAHGVTLESPEPVPLPKTVWERGAKGDGTELASWLGLLKIAILAGIGITGAVTLYASARELNRRVRG